MRTRRIMAVVLFFLFFVPPVAAGREMPSGFLKTDDREFDRKLSQPVSVDFRNSTIEEVFVRMHRMTGVDFDVSYDKGAAESPKTMIDFTARGIPLRDVLWFLSRNYRMKISCKTAMRDQREVGVIDVRILDPQMKKVRMELFLGIIIIFFIMLIMVIIVFRKSTAARKDSYLDNIANFSEDVLISRMFSDRRDDFIYQVLAMDRLGVSESLEARNALLENLKSTDLLIRKIAFAKLKKKYAVEELVADIEKITEEEIKKIRKVVLEDLIK